jgi:hypothetical protein
MSTRADKLEKLLRLTKTSIALGDRWAEALAAESRAQISESYMGRLCALKRASEMRVAMYESDEAIRRLVDEIEEGEP